MADKPTETSQDSTQQAERETHPARAGGKRRAVKALILLIVVAVAGIATWRFLLLSPDFQSRVTQGLKSFPFTAADAPLEPAPAQEKPLTPAITHRQAAALVSKEDVLMAVGRRPGDPAHALLQSLERPVVAPAGEGKTPSPEEQEASAKLPAASEPGPLPHQPEQSAVALQPAPQLVETPIVLPREPGSPKKRKKTQRELAVSPPPKPAVSEPTPSIVETPLPEKGPARAEKPVEQPVEKAVEKPASRVALLKPPEPEGESKAEKYQVPGSLRVDVQNYRGAKVKWGLLVVLDDSAVMGKKLKTWETSRLDVGSQLVSKLPSALTPGSKLSVRDFYCKKQDDKKPVRPQPCLSRTLYPWGELPCRGLEEKLKKLDPGGETNPCAAVAYALKSDIAGLGDLKPRVLIVTAGAKRCNLKEVLAETDKKGARGAVKIDVAALGMSKKGLHDYTALAEKTGGMIMKFERPADLEPALARYTKALQTPAMKQMDIQGEKVSLKIGNGEELTLAPGTYTVVLPQMPGLDQSKRTIKNIKVSSGQTSVLNVNITKGRVEVTKGTK